MPGANLTYVIIHEQSHFQADFLFVFSILRCQLMIQHQQRQQQQDILNVCILLNNITIITRLNNRISILINLNYPYRMIINQTNRLLPRIMIRKNANVNKPLKKHCSVNCTGSFSLTGSELEVTGNVRNLSPMLWTLSQLTALYLNDNQLTRLPSEIACLVNLVSLDLSNNKLRNLPSEIGRSLLDEFISRIDPFSFLSTLSGELISLRELNLTNNSIRNLPYEIGKLFRLQSLGNEQRNKRETFADDRCRSRFNGQSITSGNLYTVHGVKWFTKIINLFSR